MRLNKFISETGVCSRREADAWIAAGRVTVNGRPGELGTQVGDGRRGAGGRAARCRRGKPRHLYRAQQAARHHLHDRTRRRGQHRRLRRRTAERIFPIGRLDKDSEGLILLTNNGDIVNEILRVEHGHEKEYLVTVERPVTATFLSMMAAGVRIGGEKTKPCVVTRTGPASFRMVLTQGLNRQIRRMCSALGYRVQSLTRVRIMHIRLGSLATGAWRDLTDAEIAPLLAARGARATAG